MKRSLAIALIVGFCVFPQLSRALASEFDPGSAYFKIPATSIERSNIFKGVHPRDQRNIQLSASGRWLWTSDFWTFDQVVTSTMTSSYPPPLEVTPLASPINVELQPGYPITSPTSGVIEPYIPPENESPATVPAISEPASGLINEDPIIGDQITSIEPESASDDQPASSVIFLWLGFIVALLIFIAGVYGSIILFTRQRSSGS